MKLSRLRSGERLALAGGVSLLVLLGLNWFLTSTPEADLRGHESGIRGVGWFAALLLLLAIAAALALVFATATRSGPALPVTLGVITTALGGLATLTVLLRLVFQPGLGIDAGNGDVDLRWPIYLALLAAAGIAAGGWRSIADERLDARESAEQRERVLAQGGPVRPAPPARTAAPAGPPDPLYEPRRG